MGEPTARFYTEHQSELSRMLTGLVQVAYDRKVALSLARKPAGDDYGIVVAVTVVTDAPVTKQGNPPMTD